VGERVGVCERERDIPLGGHIDTDLPKASVILQGEVLNTDFRVRHTTICDFKFQILAFHNHVTIDKFPTLSEPMSSLLNGGGGAGKSEGEAQYLPHWVFSALN
jgi:hypothetical protein